MRCRDRIARLARAALPGLLLGAGAAGAQTQDRAVIAMQSDQVLLRRLAPDTLSAAAPFVLDGCTEATVDIASTARIDASIDAPGGQRIDDATIAGLGGELARYEVEEAAPDLLVLSLTAGVFHLVFRFPYLEPGTYTLRLAAAPDARDEIAVLTQVSLDSAVRAGLLVTPAVPLLGEPVALSAALLDENAPVAGADVQIQVLRDGTTAQTLAARDDGSGADANAGDGLYSVAFTPDAAGTYRVRAALQGTTGAGPFARTAAAVFTVAPRSARFVPPIADRGVDDDGNGLFDRLELRVPLAVETGGAYRVFVHLRTAAGAALARTSAAPLAAGAAALIVDVDAAALRELGEDGPYDVVLLELQRLDPVPVLTDRLYAAGRTGTYTLAQFESAPVRLAGPAADTAVDDDGDGRFDRLRVTVPVELPVYARYRWSLRLTAPDGAHVAFAARRDWLEPGRFELPFDFAAADIAAIRADGPYRLVELLVEGPREARSFIPLLGATAAYRAADFGAACVGDCLGDGALSIDELVRGVNIALGSLPLAECAALDADRDGRVAVNELVTAVRNALEGCAP